MKTVKTFLSLLFFSAFFAVGVSAETEDLSKVNSGNDTVTAYFYIFVILLLIFAVLVIMDIIKNKKKGNGKGVLAEDECEKKLMISAIAYFDGDCRRINHFIKVYGFSKAIADGEKLDTQAERILLCAAILHDIGIKVSEAKNGLADGKSQEREGPPAAKELMKSIGYESGFIDRVCFIIAHHHTYSEINSTEFQILVEADFIVNAFEDNLSREAINTGLEKVFRTETGRRILTSMYLGEK